jgi:transposase-like protein
VPPVPKAKPKGQKLTLDYIARHFSDEDAAYRFVERQRWPNGPVCPHCGSVDRARYLEPRDGPRKTRTGKATFRRVWKCAECGKQFSVLVGTIFEDSRIPRYKWLLAIHMLCSAKNGVAARELARTLEVTVKSAWFMAHRLRYAMEHPTVAGAVADKLGGIVEADETYIGGRVDSRGMTRSKAARIRMENKTAVVSLVERGGDVRSRVMQAVTGDNIAEVLAENVERSATLMTDGSRLYAVIGCMHGNARASSSRDWKYG